MIGWLRTGVPLVLTLIFALPLTVIARNRTIRGEPMVILILNMTIILFLFNFTSFALSAIDVQYGYDMPQLLCGVLMLIGVNIFGGFKVSTFFLALEQYIAVVFSLRHFTIMSRWVKRMVALTWFYIVTLTVVGLVCHHLELETVAEFDIRVLGIGHEIQKCGWQMIPNAFMVAFQACFLLFSMLTCAILLYTAYQGFKHEKRIAKGDVSHQTRRFMMRFKSFKRIVKLLVIFLLIDIIGTGIHIASRWFTLPPVFLNVTHFARVISLIVEYWAYGASNTIIRRAVRLFFGFRPSPEESEIAPWAPERTPQIAASDQLVVADLEAASGN
ncbi:hypothetical protein FJT64_006955 [Amphibalanus amphitrite]|uniref:G-protein coupled receptors family 1 profile domain-containing protein n=1 Tax=Amphibalanus amphitrite TaxID=1232801 RepID=A0A6A4VPH9_AMPAM|nr:hypothetical protein FJT64_006955 [Amphibalanus amphitrite]